MDWNDYRYLVVLADAGSMTSAAQRLKTTPATVSRHLQRMTKQVGRPLFQKRMKRWELTPEGREIYDVAKKFSQKIDTLSVGDMVGVERAHTIRVACPAHITAQMIAPRMRDLTEQHPNITLEFYSIERGLSLAYGDIDLSVRVVRPTEGLLVGKRLGTEMLCPVRLAQGGLDDWVALTKIVDQSGACERAGRIFGRDPVFRLPSYALMRDTMLQTGFSGAMPSHMLGGFPELIRDTTKDTFVENPLWLIYHESRRNDPALAIVLDFVTSAIREGLTE